MANIEYVNPDFGECIGYEGQSELYKCPECDHKLRVTRSIGLFHCFNCGYGTGLRLKESVNAKPIIRKTKHNPKLKPFINDLLPLLALSQYGQNYLKEDRKILTPEVYGIKSSPLNILSLVSENFDISKLIEDGLWKSQDKVPYWLTPGRLLIPYSTLKNGIVSLKSRTTPFLDAYRNEVVRYIVPEGSTHSNHLFKPCNLKRNSVLVVTEGEFKAIVVNYFGYNCVSFTSITYTKSALFEFLEIIKHFKFVFIIFDNDKNFEEQIGPVKAYLSILKHAPNTYPLILPKKDKDTKLGVDDFLYEGNDLEYEMDLSVKNKSKIIDYLENLYATIKNKRVNNASSI